MPDRPPIDETLAAPDTGEPLWSGAEAAPSGAPPERYEIVGELARGGLGRILEAYDHELERSVAVKELLRDTPGNRTRFHREILFTARLQHPAIVPLYEVVHLPDGRERYAMKLVSGRTLDQAAAEAGTVEGRLALLPNVLAVADALAYAHAQGVVHRDVKPQNVLIGEFGETVLIDWGVAKDLGPPDAARPEAGADADSDPVVAPAASGLTRAGSLVGTPAYMAPEQARGEPADFRADVYALGATLYHVLTGSLPFGDDVVRTVEALASGLTPEPLEQRAPGVPGDLLSIVRRAMAPDKADRYPTARELAEDLHRFNTGQLVAARRYTPADLLRRWLVQHRALVGVVTAAAVLLLLVAAVSARKVVAERDEAEAAHAVAVTRANALVLAHARRGIEQDPTEAASWLATYPADAPEWDTVFRLAQEVESRGVARFAARHSAEGCDGAVYSATGRELFPGAVRLGPLDAATGARLGTIDLSRTDEVRALPEGGGVAVDGVGNVARFAADGATTPLGKVGAVPTTLATDGRYAVVGDRSGAVTTFDVDTGEARVAHAGAARVSTVTARDGRWYSAAGDGEVWAGDLGGDAARRLVAHPSPIQALAQSEDGALFYGDAAGGVYTLREGEGPRRILDLPAAVTMLAASADGRHVAAADGTTALVALDRATGRRTSPAWPASRALGLAWAPGRGDLLAASLQDGTLRLWRPSTGDVAVRRSNARVHAAAAFRPDGAELATCGIDGSLRAWTTPAVAGARYRGHEGRVFHLQFLADGSIVSDSDDRTVRDWLPGGGDGPVLQMHEDRVYGLDVSPDRSRVLSAGLDGKAVVWNPTTGTTTVIDGGAGRVHRAMWLPDGERILTVHQDGVLALWAADGKPIREVQAYDGTAWWAVVDRAGTVAWAVGGDRTLRRWDLVTGELTTVLTGLGPAGGPTLRVHRLADDHVLTCDPGAALVVVSEEGTRRIPYTGGGGCASMVASPDGRLLAVVEGPTIKLLTPATGEWRDLVTLDTDVHSVAFSPDGRLLATAGLDGTARVWRVGEVPAEGGGNPPGFGDGYIAYRAESAVLGVAFSPDGRRLAASGVDPTVWVGPVDEAALVPRDKAALQARIAALTTVRARE